MDGLNNNWPRDQETPIGDWPGGQKAAVPPTKLIQNPDGSWRNINTPGLSEAQLNSRKLQEKCDKFMLDGILGKVVKKGKRR